MIVDDIKKEFVKYMEEMHVGLLYPKKFFGTMMAVLVEQEPITQDRIEQLTGYSKTTISQMLQLIQVNFSLKQVKKSGIRKKYYTIDLPVRDFMIIFLKTIIDSYKDKVDFLIPLIEEITPYTQQHQKFSNLKQFLEKSHEMAILLFKLFSDTDGDFTNLLKTGQVYASELRNFNLLSSQENMELVQNLFKPPKIPLSFSDALIMDEKLAELYTQLKNKYYQKFRENLTLGESQTRLAKTIIGTELLLEQRPLTQEEIENATHFQRSIISDTLKLLFEWKMIRVIKKPRDRKKYYMAVQSWDTRMINKLRVNMKYAYMLKEKMEDLIKMINPINENEENKMLLSFFQEIYHCYDQYEHYFKLLEVKYLNIRLKKYLKSKRSNSD